jgi:hypothetical protein
LMPFDDKENTKKQSLGECLSTEDEGLKSK